MLFLRNSLHFAEALQLLVSDEALNHVETKRSFIFLVLPLFYPLIGLFVIKQRFTEVLVLLLLPEFSQTWQYYGRMLGRKRRGIPMGGKAEGGGAL